MSKKSRCDACHKKVGIMGHSCKCGKLFCISHLQAEEHQCTYDYKTEGRLQLEKDQLVGPLYDKMVDRI
jgi:hypothetical protein